MGRLSEMHRKNRFRKPRTNRDPLRTVVGQEPLDPASDQWGREILECGHKVSPRQDFIGVVHAKRRRCPHCGKEKKVVSDSSDMASAVQRLRKLQNQSLLFPIRDSSDHVHHLCASCLASRIANTRRLHGVLVVLSFDNPIEKLSGMRCSGCGDGSGTVG